MKQFLRALASLPAAILPLLPSFTCPACLAAYTGVLSAAGLTFLLDERVLQPLIVVFLAANVLSIALSARSHRLAGPLGLTLLGSLAVVTGRRILGVSPVLYIGVALLFFASLWNLWQKRRRPAPLIPTSVLGEKRHDETNH